MTRRGREERRRDEKERKNGQPSFSIQSSGCPSVRTGKHFLENGMQQNSMAAKTHGPETVTSWQAPPVTASGFVKVPNGKNVPIPLANVDVTRATKALTTCRSNDQRSDAGNISLSESWVGPHQIPDLTTKTTLMDLGQTVVDQERSTRPAGRTQYGLKIG